MSHEYEPDSSIREGFFMALVLGAPIALIALLTSGCQSEYADIGAPEAGPAIAQVYPDEIIRPSQIVMLTSQSIAPTLLATDATNASFQIRDYPNGDSAHAAMTFPLGQIPSAVIMSAQVTFRIEAETSGLYTSLGGLFITKLTSRSTIQAAAYSDNGTALGLFLNGAGAAEREVSFDVTQALEASRIAHDAYLTLKLRFASDTDGVADNDALTLYGHASDPNDPLFFKSPRLTVSFQ